MRPQRGWLALCLRCGNETNYSVDRGWRNQRLIYICRNTMRSATKAAAKENTPRQVYEHDWARQALDKMNKVVRDVREQIKDAQSP